MQDLTDVLEETQDKPDEPFVSKKRKRGTKQDDPLDASTGGEHSDFKRICMVLRKEKKTKSSSLVPVVSEEIQEVGSTSDESNETETESQHAQYVDELFDYFLLSRSGHAVICPSPPVSFPPDYITDADGHTALHWAAAMGDKDVAQNVKKIGANLAAQNRRGETPLMRAVTFSNCREGQSFPVILEELYSTVDKRDSSGCTVIHHAAASKNSHPSNYRCARYYLDCIMTRLQQTHDRNFITSLLDAQDGDGNTALHLAVQRNARKSIMALLGYGASTEISNIGGKTARDLIIELNTTRLESSRSTGQEPSSSSSSSSLAPSRQEPEHLEPTPVRDSPREQ